MRQMKATVLFLIISLCSVFVQAVVKVSATVDRPELGVGDTVTLSVTVQSDESVRVEEPRVPNLNGLKLVQSSQDSAESNQMVTTSSGMKFVKINAGKSGTYHHPWIRIERGRKSLHHSADQTAN